MKKKLRAPERIATPSIRGYYYQFLWTATHWLQLPNDETLVCEGAEDIDRLKGTTVEQESLKHLAKNLTENSEAVRDALLEFAAEYLWQVRRGCTVRFLFRTTAKLAAARKDPFIGHWLSGKPVDELALFTKLAIAARNSKHRDALIALRYMRKHMALGSFAAAVRWNFGEVE
jgi:hypothetical protein